MNRTKTQENYIEAVLEDMDLDAVIQLARESLEQSVSKMSDEDLVKDITDYGYEDCIEE